MTAHFGRKGEEKKNWKPGIIGGGGRGFGGGKKKRMLSCSDKEREGRGGLPVHVDPEEVRSGAGVRRRGKRAGKEPSLFFCGEREKGKERTHRGERCSQGQGGSSASRKEKKGKRGRDSVAVPFEGEAERRVKKRRLSVFSKKRGISEPPEGFGGESWGSGLLGVRRGGGRT